MTLFAEIVLVDFRKPLAQRKRTCTGPYRWTPAKPGVGRGFYQASRGGLRVDEAGSSFRLRLEDAGKPSWHHSENDDEFQPIIARLPRSRGFLAGWTLGRGMCGALDATIHDDEEDARHAASEEARVACDHDLEMCLQLRAEDEGISRNSSIPVDKEAGID